MRGDLYLTCPKFITTSAYAPRLRERLDTEFTLITDAHERGWQREAERHTTTVDRIHLLLDELNDPHAVAPLTPEPRPASTNPRA